MNLLSILPMLGTLLERLLPDPKASAEAKLELMRLAQSGELAQLEADKQIQLGQISVNLEDAKAGGIFRAGWRPFLGWTCGVALAWEWVFKQIFVTVWVLASSTPLPALPQLNLEQIAGLVLALLGLGTMRTVERVKGKA